MEGNSINTNLRHKLIITIVKRGMSVKVIAASKSEGAEGGTIFLGFGSTREDIYNNILGVNFEPEKDIIFTFVKEEIAYKVLDKIKAAANLDMPGTGISFIVDIKNITGIYHLMNIGGQYNG